MNILLLRGFNNYFNRTVKKYSTLADYRSNSSSYLDLANINFNPNDGVATELVIGSVNQKENNAPLDWENIGTPDYLICYENNVIKFRWFVLESERTRAGQYRIALKRDVLAENFNKIIKAPCFVEKGTINDINDPLLYNNESLTYNQIKKAEYELKDNTGTGWIVGYMSKNRANTPVTVSTSIAINDGVPAEYFEANELPFSVNPDSSTTAYGYTPDSMSLLIPITYFRNGGWGKFYVFQGWKALNYNSNAGSSMNQTQAYVNGEAIGDYDPLTQFDEWGCDKFSQQVSGYATEYSISFGNSLKFKLSNVIGSNINVSGKKYFYTWDTPLDHDQDKQAPESVITTLAPSSATVDPIKTLVNSYMQNDGYGVVYGDIRTLYNDKYVKINNEYYRMSIEPNGVNRYDLFNSNAANNAFPTVSGIGDNLAYRHTKYDLNTPMVNMLNSLDTTNFSMQTYLKPSLFAVAQSIGYNIVLSRITTETIDVTLQTGKRITYDCPANIFAIPYGTFKFRTSDASAIFTTQKEEGLALAREIASTLGSDVCYDLQLVPYVPSQLIRDLMQNSDTLNLSDLETANYDIATRTAYGTTTIASFVLYPSSCKGTFDIMQTINKYNSSLYSAALNAKISNEVQLCRLVSPNFNGMFEFSLAKNNGVSKFNVDYTYKPIMPYIHINPDFKFIYGRDWDDARGLILGGDFSLTFINNAWVTYENNNKNYQAIFNRQIENMDVNNKIAREQQDFKNANAMTNMITGTLSPVNAIGSFLKAGITNPLFTDLGVIKETDWLRRQQEEAKSYATDMYGYQLGNIKAMPYSLSRSESLTNNNKIYPIVELYEPTEKEINNLVNKLNYNGMTIMAIGKLEDYMNSEDFNLSFVKGQLIRLETIDDDFHIADAIYQEVNKGFYVISRED